MDRWIKEDATMYHDGNNIRKLPLLLAFCLLLGLLAGCGKKDNDAQQLSANVYVPKYLDLNIDEDYIYESGSSDGKFLYFIAGKDEEIKQPSDSGDTDDMYYYSRTTYSIYRVALDGSDTVEKLPGYIGPSVPDGMDGSCSVGQLAAGQDGTLWVTEQTYVWGSIMGNGGISTLPAPIVRAEAATEDAINDVNDVAVDTVDEEPAVDESYTIITRRQLDQDGNELQSFDMSNLENSLSDILGEDEYLSMQAFDSQGNLYVGSDSKLYALNPDLSVRFTLEGEDMWYEPIPLSNGLMGMQMWNDDEETETRTHTLKIIDPEKQDWGTEYILPQNAYQILPGGGDYLFYYQASNAVFGFKAGEINENGMGTGTTERLFSWLDADINSDEVQSFSMLPDGRVAATLQQWNRDAEKSNFSVVIMTSTPRDQLPEKTNLIYATLYLSYSAKNAILDFNRKSDSYRIEVKDYSEYIDDDPTGNAALQKLNTEILAGNLPDILDTSNLPMRQYGAKGILEDLWPFIDNDPEISRDGLMIRPLEANQQDGKLYEIFSDFSITTVAGPTKIVGDRTSWTLADLQDALSSMPDGCAIFGEYDTKDEMLSTLISLNMDQFVNWNTGECSFDSEQFKAMLEFCNSFPAEFDWNNVDWDEWEEEEGRLMTGKQLLMQTSIYDINWGLQRLKAVFNGDYSFVGYPKEDGSCGSSFSTGAGVAMTTACKDKDGAWSFIRQKLLPKSSESDGYYYYGDFSINKTDFDKMIDNALNSRYETDENGDPLLDDDGNPIPLEYGSMWVTDEIQIKLGPVEQADVDKVMALYNSIDSLYRYDEKIMDAVNEVAGQYFAGDKPLDETASLIQNKVKLYVNESR